MALGAGKVQLLTAVMRQFVWPVAIGMAVGRGLQQRLRECCASPFTESATSTRRATPRQFWC